MKVGIEMIELCIFIVGFASSTWAAPVYFAGGDHVRGRLALTASAFTLAGIIALSGEFEL